MPQSLSQPPQVATKKEIILAYLLSPSLLDRVRDLAFVFSAVCPSTIFCMAHDLTCTLFDIQPN